MLAFEQSLGQNFLKRGEGEQIKAKCPSAGLEPEAQAGELAAATTHERMKSRCRDSAALQNKFVVRVHRHGTFVEAVPVNPLAILREYCSHPRGPPPLPPFFGYAFADNLAVAEFPTPRGPTSELENPRRRVETQSGSPVR